MKQESSQNKHIIDSMDHPDVIVKGLVPSLNIRFSYLSLGQSWQDMHGVYDYPENVLQELGKVVAGSLLVKAQLKEDYSIYMQIQDGFENINFLSSQARPHDSDANKPEYLMRAVARWQDDNVALLGENSASHHQAGRLIVTVSSPNTQKYQGIVALDKHQDIAFNLASYFSQSEQLKTWIKIYVDEKCVKGMMIQALPSTEDIDYTKVDEYINESDLAQWHAQLRLNTPEQMIKDTFYQEEITLFDPIGVAFSCTCSEYKIHQVIQSLGQQEAMEIVAEKGQISMQCEFCQTQYSCSPSDVERLFER